MLANARKIYPIILTLGAASEIIFNILSSSYQCNFIGISFLPEKIFLLMTENTLKCLSIGTPKTINFPFASNGKLMVFRCPNIQAHYNGAVIYLIFGTSKNNDFPFGTNGKFIIFRCPNT